LNNKFEKKTKIQQNNAKHISIITKIQTHLLIHKTINNSKLNQNNAKKTKGRKRNEKFLP
jgi:hypothetical protein